MRLERGEFLGSAVRVVSAGGFTVTEYAYPPRLALAAHEHRFAYVSFPLAGSYEERCGSKTFDCSSSSAVFHPKGEEHADKFGSAGGRIFSVEVADSWLDALRDDGTPIDSRRGFVTPALLRSAANLRRVIAAEHRSHLRVQSAAIDILANLPATTVEDREPRWLQSVVDCLRSSQPRRMATSELARVAGVHPVHLARTFRRVYDCTISEYVRELRVENAMALLRRGDSFADIALATGFADQSHFCRDFKRVTGVTPAEFRGLRSFKTQA